MPSPGSSGRQNWIFIFFTALAFFIILFLIATSIHFYKQVNSSDLNLLSNLALCLMACLVPILLGWIGLRKIGVLLFSFLATAIAILDVIATKRQGFAIFPICYFAFFALAYWVERRMSSEMVVREIEIEKQLVEKNNLELTFKEKGESISVCFEKYSTYYNLRRLADEFSTKLDLASLGDLVVTRTLGFIQKGNWCLLFLAQPDKDEISLVASKNIDPNRKTRKKLGDLFDFWVLRTRQHLLVTDTQNDFRFDSKKMAALEEVRSAILSPLIHEGKVVGTLRINSDLPETFNMDHLRLLDAISTLSSSAISNAMLYQKTEELAIRDSLTHLYVQRYFLERLREEHKRALLTQQPLSLLMCDLDYFKEINDRYGHAIGDFVLVRVAEVLREFFENGIIARYGGEEFTILLPHISKKEAYSLANDMRTCLENEKIEIRRENIKLTVSIGVANLPEDTLDTEELIHQADKHLYQAKRSGRNQVC